MKDKPLKTGSIGTVVMALRCFTPILGVLATTVGLAAIAGYLDSVLFPALAMLIITTIYAPKRQHARNIKS